LSKRYTSRCLLEVKVDLQLVDPHVLPLAACVAELGQGAALEEAVEPLAGAGLIPHAAQAGEEALLVPHELHCQQLAAHQGFDLRFHLLPLGLVVVAHPQTAGALPKSDLVFEAEDFQVVFPLVERLGVQSIVFLGRKKHLHCVDVLNYLFLHVSVDRVI
jgi:hypothetical protein